MNYVTIYFKNNWHVSGSIDQQKFDWTCKTESKAHQIARNLIKEAR